MSLLMLTPKLLHLEVERIETGQLVTRITVLASPIEGEATRRRVIPIVAAAARRQHDSRAVRHRRWAWRWLVNDGCALGRGVVGLWLLLASLGVAFDNLDQRCHESLPRTLSFFAAHGCQPSMICVLTRRCQSRGAVQKKALPMCRVLRLGDQPLVRRTPEEAKVVELRLEHSRATEAPACWLWRDR